MIERLLIATVLFAVSAAFYVTMTRRQIKRLSSMQVGDDPIMDALKPGVPAIVYFTTPHCVPCRTQQQPALAAIADILGRDKIQIVKIDATQDPQSADRWGVLAAPTTFIIDERGIVQAVNHGVADAAKLRRQLQATA